MILQNNTELIYCRIIGIACNLVLIASQNNVDEELIPEKIQVLHF